MIINKLLEQKKISKYRFSKNCGISYTTLNDICLGKAKIEKCSAETIYKIAKELNVSMESILEPYMEKRGDFELFKSNVCHRVKELGDIDFIINLLESNKIRKLYEMEWYPESLYLLAMLDYLSRINNVPICTDYNDMRECKLKLVNGNYEQIYSAVRAEEISSKDMLVDFEKRYTNVANESNVDDILKSFKRKKQ